MLRINATTKFKRDFKLAQKLGLNMESMRQVIVMLQNETPLPDQYRDHALNNSRNYKNCRECHIEPDWLLVYQVEQEVRILDLIRTGTHSDLFKK